jgi:hypothetical protein
MAKGLIDPKTTGGGKAARDYYDIFREEPTSKDITSIVEHPEISAHASLSTLPDAIMGAFAYKHFQGSDVLIVAHGSEKGLIMPLVVNSQTSAFTEVLEFLIGDDSPEAKAKRTRLSQKQVSSLLDQIAAVQNLGLGAIEFRGCVIGSRQENLQVLKDFFGAWRVSAPTVKSNFGSFLKS